MRFVYFNLKFCLLNLINFCLKMSKELGDKKQLWFQCNTSSSTVCSFSGSHSSGAASSEHPALVLISAGWQDWLCLFRPKKGWWVCVPSHCCFCSGCSLCSSDRWGESRNQTFQNECSPFHVVWSENSSGEGVLTPSYKQKLLLSGVLVCMWVLQIGLRCSLK